MTHDKKSRGRVQCQVLQSAAVVRIQQVVLAAIVPTDLVCTGQYSRRHGPFPVCVACHSEFAKKRAVPSHAHRLDFGHVQFCTEM